MRIAIVVALVAGFGLLIQQVSSLSYKRGVSDQIARNAEDYQTIREQIDAGTIDANDDTAVLCELYRLAGTEPEGVECSGL